jgi:hypothetical protein
MLLGAGIEIFTDHKNLTYNSSANQRIIRQLNYLEEYSPRYHHLPGELNVIADVISRLPCRDDISYPSEEEKERLSKIDISLYHCTSIHDDPELVECFLNLPDLNEQPFPLDFEHIAQGQQADASQRRMAHPLSYPSQFLQGLELMSYRATPTATWQICIPSDQLIVLVQWFHAVLGHCGIHRLRDSMATRFTHPRLRATVNEVIKHCHPCH